MLNNFFKCTRSIIKVLSIKIMIEQVQEQREFYLKLKAFGRMSLKNASEETSLKKSS